MIYKFIKRIFHRHKLVSFKHCAKHLVAAYCEKCGCIKVGNPCYGDGSYYQKTLYDEKAIEFIDKDIEYVTNKLKNEFNYDYKYMDSRTGKIMTKDELIELNNDVLNYYESPERLNEIKSIIYDL